LRAGVRGREEEVEVAWTLIAGSAHVAIDLDWLRDFLRVMCASAAESAQLRAAGCVGVRCHRLPRGGGSADVGLANSRLYRSKFYEVRGGLNRTMYLEICYKAAKEQQHLHTQ
jgi:hypothetical protein